MFILSNNINQNTLKYIIRKHKFNFYTSKIGFFVYPLQLMFLLFKSSLSKKQEKMLLAHKYKAVDRSILSTYFFKKYTSVILSYTPECISPNMITLMGFVAMIINFFVVIWYDIELDNKEDWIALLSAMSLFFYFTMDNLDGAQARKIKEMSPMGQLFDHGVDSCAVFFCMITMISSLQLGLSYTSIMSMLAVMFGFYFSGLEERFTGLFEFGPISGPTEGVIFMVILHLMSAYYDNTLRYTVDRITFYPPLTRLVTFIPISPLFIIALVVFVYNFVTSFKKSLLSKKQNNFKDVIFSYLSISFLIIPLLQFHWMFPLRPDLRIINLIIFGQIFSLKYIEEVYCNMIGCSPYYINPIYLLYCFSSFLLKYKKTCAGNFIMISLFMVSTFYYSISIYSVILACKKALNISILYCNKKNIKKE